MPSSGEHSRKSDRWRLWPVTLAAIGLLLAANAGRSSLRFNWTASAAVGLYRQQPLQLTRGGFVSACLPDRIMAIGRTRGYIPRGDCPDGTSPVLKVLAGLPGDGISLRRAFTVVNGKRVSEAPLRASDAAGRPLDHFPLGEHTVPEGHVWLLGADPTRSWDSRYFGPVPIESLVGSARPLLTFNPGHP